MAGTSSSDLEDALSSCGLSHLSQKMKEQKITMDLIQYLTDEEFEKIGIVAAGDRIRMRRLCGSARPVGASDKECDSGMKRTQLMDTSSKDCETAHSIMKRLATTPVKQLASKKKGRPSPPPSRRNVICSLKRKMLGETKWTQVKKSKTYKGAEKMSKALPTNITINDVHEVAKKHFFPDGCNHQFGQLAKFRTHIADYNDDMLSLSCVLSDIQIGKSPVRVYLLAEEKDDSGEMNDDSLCKDQSDENFSDVEEDSAGDVADADSDSESLPSLFHTRLHPDVNGLLGKIRILLADIVGLTELKDQLCKFAKQSIIDDMRRAANFTVSIKRPVMVFSGNPGTGKTSVASIVAEIMHMTGLVKRSRLTTVQRDSLVSNHIGETAMKTSAVLESAAGETLLIDEAYRLSSTDRVDFGQEAIDTLMASIEGGHVTTSDRPALIFAGYPGEMDCFLKANSGFRRRITHVFHFPDYTTKELTNIFHKMALKDGYIVNIPNSRMEGLMKEKCSKFNISRHNAGLCAMLYAAAKERLDERLFNKMERRQYFATNQLMTIEVEDVQSAIMRS